jgi:hypothetical protein
MEREFTESTWILEEGIYRIDYDTETYQKMLIQVFKLTEDAYAATSEQDVVIMRKDKTITIATRNPFTGYLIAK